MTGHLKGCKHCERLADQAIGLERETVSEQNERLRAEGWEHLAENARVRTQAGLDRLVEREALRRHSHAPVRLVRAGE